MNENELPIVEEMEYLRVIINRNPKFDTICRNNFI